MLKKAVISLGALVLVGCGSSAPTTTSVQDVSFNYPQSRVPANFDHYVDYLRQQAVAQGVDPTVVYSQQNIQFVTRSIELDQQQAGRKRSSTPSQPNPNGVTNYLNRVLTSTKVALAVRYFAEQRQEVETASRRFGVQPQYLVALWGMESSFGRYQGNFDVLSVLATLAFEGRRESLFANEFIKALSIIDKGHIEREKMKGSWAGAMGQTQFMPSSYLSYARDGDNDGIADIWQNYYDAFASIANYLATVGWNNQLPWGVEVQLSGIIDQNIAGTENGKARSLADWQRLGIILPQDAFSQRAIAQLQRTRVWLVLPNGLAGRAFLVSQNFKTIMDWNKSYYFAISIGKFADEIAQRTGL
ncbi:lytic transglycosylase [Gallibacterium salpingitidis]|uniref:Lytic transglycosylase n=1 Tax=Gallibacterium salpingitidis TaxID=505341 RepID=A0AB36DZU4_9PAST|nr:lytic murein transglycosylase [Gallibacterium salpingitidis]OBX07257.1 lytic transglycosylase [Gallibacterium salpingitidis]WKS98555.1 lytic murein transglycosylase [Gallibacterium salpingitidis]